MARKKKAKGRPVKYVLPEPIEGYSVEEIASTVLQARPPIRWRYMEEAERAKLEAKKPNEGEE